MYVCELCGWVGRIQCTQQCLAVCCEGKQPWHGEDLFVKYAKSCAYSKSLFTLLGWGRHEETH